MKKVFTTAFGIVLMILAFSPMARADKNGTCGENLTWSLNDNGVLVIQGNGDLEDFPVFPAEDIREIQIKEGITRIGAAAFAGCSECLEIALPESLQSIGNHAFSNCISLSKLSFPSGLQSIGEFAFFKCEALIDVMLPEHLKMIG